MRIIALNRNKIKLCFFVNSIFFGLLSICLLIYGKSTNQFPDWLLLFGILFCSFFIMPLAIITIVSIDWYFKALRRKKAFAKIFPKLLEPNGFKSDFINIDSKWVLTEEIFSKTYKTQKVFANNSKVKNQIEFWTDQGNHIRVSKKDIELMDFEKFQQILNKII